MQTTTGSGFKTIQINGLEFQQVHLTFEPGLKTNLFALKNNKTLGETIREPRYRSLAALANDRYPESLHMALGEFLLERKRVGDPVYKMFLNRYGDETYNRFSVQDSDWLDRKGLYCYVLDEVVVYVGQSRDCFGKRINQGYGNISPKNCYLDGQATNCHVNSLVTRHQATLKLILSEVKNLVMMDDLEKKLIKIWQPLWNIARKNKGY